MTWLRYPQRNATLGTKDNKVNFLHVGHICLNHLANQWWLLSETFYQTM